MARIKWNAPEDRRYEYGIDQGVVYSKTAGRSAAWNGIKSVTQAPVGADVTSFYLDGEKFNQMIATEEYAATLVAFSAPDLFFEENDGLSYYGKGLYVDSQDRQMFDLSYRTQVGDGRGAGQSYKIHLVYNALAAPTGRAYSSEAGAPSPIEHTWSLTTMPIRMTGKNPSAHYIIDSRRVSKYIMAQIEDILYGTVSKNPRMPTADELIKFFKNAQVVTVTDNKDGTWTAQGPDDIIQFISWTEFIIDYDLAQFLPGSDDTYTLSTSATAE